MNLAAPGYTLAAVVLVPLIAWLVNVRLLGVQLIAWHGYDAASMATREARHGSPDSHRDSLAAARALLVAGAAALAWIVVAALTAPNLAHAPWPSSSSSGMHLDAPGYVLAVVPFMAALVWFASRGDVGRAGPRVLRVMGAVALLHHFKRLLIRYDRRHEIHHAFLAIGCCLVCHRRLTNSS